VYKSDAEIRKVGNQHCVFSKSGKKLGCFDSRDGAVKRLKQIEFFKSKSSDDMNYEKAFTNLSLGSDVNPETVGQKPEGAPQQLNLNVEDSFKNGTIAGNKSPRLLDTRDHFPVITEIQAKAALSRVMQLTENPVWYNGSLDQLREEVYVGAIEKHPHLRDVNVGVPANQVIALSDGETSPETSTSDIENPADVRKNDVKTVKRPTITTAEILAAQSEDEETRKVMAGNLMEHLEKQKEGIDKAMKVATRLLKKGLTADEFNGLVSFLQEDILRELLFTGTTAEVIDRRQELLAKLNKNDQ
jgi:hypothetical protein